MLGPLEQMIPILAISLGIGTKNQTQPMTEVNCAKLQRRNYNVISCGGCLRFTSVLGLRGPRLASKKRKLVDPEISTPSPFARRVISAPSRVTLQRQFAAVKSRRMTTSTTPKTKMVCPKMVAIVSSKIVAKDLSNSTSRCFLSYSRY